MVLATYCSNVLPKEHELGANRSHSLSRATGPRQIQQTLGLSDQVSKDTRSSQAWAKLPSTNTQTGKLRFRAAKSAVLNPRANAGWYHLAGTPLAGCQLLYAPRPAANRSLHRQPEGEHTPSASHPQNQSRLESRLLADKTGPG